jgi:hypothetical protein
MRLIFHPDAETELVEAARFYEGRVPALGAQFLDAVDAAVHVIEQAQNGGAFWKPMFVAASCRGFLTPSTIARYPARFESSPSNITPVIPTTGVIVSTEQRTPPFLLEDVNTRDILPDMPSSLFARSASALKRLGM